MAFGQGSTRCAQPGANGPAAIQEDAGEPGQERPGPLPLATARAPLPGWPPRPAAPSAATLPETTRARHEVAGLKEEGNDSPRSRQRSAQPPKAARPASRALRQHPTSGH